MQVPSNKILALDGETLRQAGRVSRTFYPGFGLQQPMYGFRDVFRGLMEYVKGTVRR